MLARKKDAGIINEDIIYLISFSSNGRQYICTQVKSLSVRLEIITYRLDRNIRPGGS